MFCGVTLLNNWLGETKSDPPMLTAHTSGICTADQSVEFAVKGSTTMFTHTSNKSNRFSAKIEGCGLPQFGFMIKLQI